MEKELLPLLQNKIKELHTVCNARNLFFRVTSCYRSNEKQTEFFNQPFDNKDNDGDGLVDEADEKITNAKAGQSFHNHRVAFDIVPLVGGKAVYDEALLGAIAYYGKQIGLEWGGDFAKFKDAPHFQITLGYTFQDFIDGKVDLSKFGVATSTAPTAPATPPGDKIKEGTLLIEKGLALIKSAS